MKRKIMGELVMRLAFFGASDFGIQYPFSPYVKDSIDSDCTAPYRIFCEDSTPTINITIDNINHTFAVTNISYHENILTVLDQNLMPFLNGSHCSFLINFTKPIHHLYFALPYQFERSNHSFFDCIWKADEIPRRIPDGNKHSTRGKDFKIYYWNESGNQVPPRNCLAHKQAPMLEWRLSFSKEEEGDDGFSLLSVGFSHYLELRPDCFNHTVILGSKSSKGKNIAIGAGAAGALIAAFFLGLFFYKRRRRQQRSASSTLLYRSTSSELSSKKDPELGSISGINYQTHIFSYDELQEATNAFDASKELGDGGFGTVYKGKLRDGRIVAVKRLYESNYKRVEQFMNEVIILSRLRHQNLVTLYGCTSRHSRELLLVYEYVPNGTVADHLHGPRASEGCLTWPVRMSIAIETADALAYLHAVEPQIIHRDVKTNNILLDNSFHVKVADFGLSRLFPLDATHVSTAPQGTPGYVDPEYHQCYQLTDKSDVYSFGVVLVELISSMPAVDITRHRHEINLATMAMNKIQNRELDKLVDLELGYHSDEEVKRMITQVAELAFRCLQMDGDMRPNIREVLEELRGIEIGDAPKPEKLGDTDIQTKEESRLLKNFPPYSPDSVADRWGSMSTTPNTSG